MKWLSESEIENLNLQRLKAYRGSIFREIQGYKIEHENEWEWIKGCYSNEDVKKMKSDVENLFKLKRLCEKAINRKKEIA